jgi:hypothetical protein
MLLMLLHSTNNIRIIITILIMSLLLILTGCSANITYEYEEDSVISIEIKESTENGWVVISVISEEEKALFLSDLPKITFKKESDDRK